MSEINYVKNQRSKPNKTQRNGPTEDIVIDKQTLFKKEFGLIVIGAVIFTVSFLWKDFIADIRNKYFPEATNLVSQFIFVMIITVILIVIVVFLREKFGLYDSQTTVKFDDEPTTSSTPETDISSAISMENYLPLGRQSDAIYMANQIKNYNDYYNNWQSY